MAILLVLSAIVFLTISFFAYRQIIMNRAKISFLQLALQDKHESLQQMSNKYESAMSEKLESIKHTEQLAAKLQQQEKLINEFEVLSKKSQEMTKSALFDLSRELSSQLIEIHKRETAESRKLSEENVKLATDKFNSEFERIVGMIGALKNTIDRSEDTVELIRTSLLSPSGAGKLAEITLENILKASGLKNGLDFLTQYNFTNEDNNKLRPDAVIFLPGDNIMVIDAKASKFLIDEPDNPEKLAKTMNFHLKSLASKDYAKNMKFANSSASSSDDLGENTGINGKNKRTDSGIKKTRAKYANIITLMFLPTEHAIEKITQTDHEFLTKAWKLNIFPVGPAGLMNMLSFARFQIAENAMMHNNLEIIEEVKKLINSVLFLAEHSMKLGANISSLVNNYDKFAGSFNRNFLSRVKNIGHLGVKIELDTKHHYLQRYQLITGKSELIELEEEKLQQITNDK